jgi:AcrR family transcriptional regulator
MPATARRQTPTATQQALVDAGAQLFASHGYDGASIHAIAAEAGVNSALVSYHFGGKSGLYNAILLTAIKAGQEALEPIRESRAPPDERLREFIAGMTDFVVRYPHFPFMLIREEMSGGRNMEDDVVAELSEFFLLDREILEDGARQGVFREIEPHAAHLSLVGALMFFYVSQPLRDRLGHNIPAHSPKLEDYVRHVQELIVRGLKP